MTWNSFKQVIWPIVITALITALGTVLAVGYASIRQLDRLTTMLEVYVPATERRLEEVENSTAVNRKRSNEHNLRLAVIEARNEQQRN